MERKYTPENITQLEPNQIFVFGSNTEGRHGKGAALLARQRFGAIYGQAASLQGQSYAIVTKDLKQGIRSIPLRSIGSQLFVLCLLAKDHPELEFLVTKLGSSLAGYTVDEIKGLFDKLSNKGYLTNNIILPKEYEVRSPTI